MRRRFRERDFPIFNIPEVSPGPVRDPAKADADPVIRAGRAIEARYDLKSTGAQRLSRDLALLYRRDVFCEGNMREGAWAEERPNGEVLWHYGLPSRGFMTKAAYMRMKVAPDVAVRLLVRDADMPVAQAWHPPEEIKFVPKKFNMPTLDQMLSTYDPD